MSNIIIMVYGMLRKTKNFNGSNEDAGKQKKLTSQIKQMFAMTELLK